MNSQAFDVSLASVGSSEILRSAGRTRSQQRICPPVANSSYVGLLVAVWTIITANSEEEGKEEEEGESIWHIRWVRVLRTTTTRTRRRPAGR
jgi:hypothetical protein